MRILITGGAGFIGTHLTRRLLAQGHHVTILDNLFTGSKQNMQEFESNPQFAFIHQDIQEPIVGQYDQIYNLACPASPVHYQKNPVETMKTSFLGMLNVLELARNTKAQVLHASTSEIYGDPLVHPQVEDYWGNVNTVGIRSCYDEGKRAAETLCSDFLSEYSVDVRMIRIFNTYGPHMHPQDGRVVSNFILQVLENKPITIYGDGLQTRSFQYVSDLVELMIRFMAKPKKELNESFAKLGWNTIPVLNAGNPHEFTMKELAEEIKELVPNSTSTITYEDLPKDDPKQRQPNISFAKAVLDWEPKVQLKEGLELTISYFKRFVE
jgi:UDP-glucuronate decarboxylase